MSGLGDHDDLTERVIDRLTTPKVIVGRFKSNPTVEWSVAVGCRVVFDAPTGYHFEVVRFDANGDTIVLKNLDLPNVGHYPISRRTFFAQYKPAPPESRWLDPASVQGRGQMQLCCVGSARSYEERCKWPAQVGDDPARRCSYHAEHPGLWERSPALLHPSALTPARRWRSLTGTKWSCGRPERVQLSRSLVNGNTGAPYWYGTIQTRHGCVRKVRGTMLVPAYQDITCAAWVIA